MEGFRSRAHKVSDGAMAVFVVLPTIGGIIVVLFSAVWGSALFSLALACGALLALHHLSVAPKLLYISAEQLRSPTPPSVVRDPVTGTTVCSACLKPSRTDAKQCANCHVAFA